jgi:hypothetical protein
VSWILIQRGKLTSNASQRTCIVGQTARTTTVIAV